MRFDGLLSRRHPNLERKRKLNSASLINARIEYKVDKNNLKLMWLTVKNDTANLVSPSCTENSQAQRQSLSSWRFGRTERKSPREEGDIGLGEMLISCVLPSSSPGSFDLSLVCFSRIFLILNSRNPSSSSKWIPCEFPWRSPSPFGGGHRHLPMRTVRARV